MKNIVIVDDEPDILELVSLNLKKHGFNTECFHEAESFLKFLDKKLPDLIILDLMLPDADGMDICKYLKKEDKFSSIPIIMLTARVDETDKILGLELGADDYVTKPFSPRELAARVKAILRRKTKSKEKTHKIKIRDSLIIDTEKYIVIADGNKIDLTSTEFRILEYLARKPGKVFTRDQILDHLWGNEKAVIDRTVDVHIKNLRDKLGETGYLIKNLRGIGYKIEENLDQNYK